MKKLFLYIFIIINLFTINPIFALNTTQNAEITKIENDIYGFDYINDELKNRVARLEKTIYGKEFNGDLANRIKKLSVDINSAEIGLEISPSEDTFREDEVVADSTVNYPIVDEIEMKLFNQTYKNRDFHTRIVTIERKLFGKIYDVNDYSTRMDRIKSAVMPDTIAKKESDDFEIIDSSSDSLPSIDLSGLNSNKYSRMPYGQQNYTRPYANYGDYGNVNSNDFKDELAEMEFNTFGTEFSTEDINTRLKRLNSVNRAKKSASKYDSQKFQQRMSTAMEIGAMILMILAMVL
jgi:hypothetical protein